MTVKYIKEELHQRGTSWLNASVYQKFCADNHIDINRAVFLYGGDYQHSPGFKEISDSQDRYISLFDWRLSTSSTYGGIMTVAHNLVAQQHLVHSLPIHFSTDGSHSTDAVNLVVKNAIASLYEACGAGYTLVLPVREPLQYKDTSQFVFTKGLDSLPFSGRYEPIFWNHVCGPFKGQEWLSDYYITELDNLTKFIQLSSEEKQTLIDDNTTNNVFYQAFKRGEQHRRAQFYQDEPEQSPVAQRHAVPAETPKVKSQLISSKKPKKLGMPIKDLEIDEKKPINQLCYLTIDPDKPIRTLADYQDSLNTRGITVENKPVFIFPGNTQAINTSAATLYSVKGDNAGLASVARMIGQQGFATLSVPITGISNSWEQNDREKALVTQAIANLYKAAGHGCTLVLPVRNVGFVDETTLFNDEALPISEDEPPQFLEPAFGGGHEKTLNPTLARHYLTELSQLHAFLSKDENERYNRKQASLINPVFWNAYMEGRTMQRNDSWLRPYTPTATKAPKPASIKTPQKTFPPVGQVNSGLNYIEGKITLESYKASYDKKVVFIFPGNRGHHLGSHRSLKERLYEIKSGSGLAQVAGQLGGAGYPVLSLPTTGMEQWSENLHGEKETVQKAIEDLYEALGLGFSLALPVRSRGNQPVLVPSTKQHFFEQGLEDAPDFEPNFWGQNNTTPNTGLAAEYIKTLNTLGKFAKLSLQDREEQMALDKANPLFKAYQRGQASSKGSVIEPRPMPEKKPAVKPVSVEKPAPETTPIPVDRQAQPAVRLYRTPLRSEASNNLLPKKIQLPASVKIPASYEKIYRDCERNDPLSRARALLNDYTKNNSAVKRIAFFHWNRNHVSRVNEIVNDSSIKDIAGLLKKLDTIELRNSKGSLARRIAFIQSKNPEVKLSIPEVGPSSDSGYKKNK